MPAEKHVNPLKIVTIPADVAFLPRLKAHVLVCVPPEQLASTLIFLPTHRACRALKELWVEPGAPAQILPRIVPLGNIEDEPLIQHLLLKDEWAAQKLLALLPVVPDAQRRLHMQTLMKHRVGEDALPAYSLALADDLLALLDECYAAQIGAEALKKVVPEALAAHWEISLRYLEVLIDAWPSLLKEQGVMERILRRNELLALLSHAWEQSPAATPVFVAGSTGSQKATANLLKTIAGLPQGQVLLAGLDTQSDSEIWESVEAGHPQFAFKQLLAHIGLTREDVQELKNDSETQNTAFMELWRNALVPAEHLHRWDAKTLAPQSLQEFHVLDCRDDAHEAKVAALLIREALEQPFKTVALITPDSQLAERAAAICQRYGLQLESTEGMPLAHTPAGVYVRLVATWMLNPTDPALLLALLQHPFTHAGMARHACLDAARELEKERLRGVIFNKGWGTYLAKKDRWQKELSAGAVALIRQMQSIADSMPLRNAQEVTLEEVLKQISQLLHQLTTDDAGVAHLWQGADKEPLQTWFHHWQEAAPLSAPIPLTSVPHLLESMFAGEVVRKVYAQHPRISILTPMEARLLHFDRVILAGVNEGVWPASIEASPWISVAMRAAAGMAAQEEHVSQQALDFYLQACSAKECFVTYSHTAKGVPALPSRFVERAMACLQAQWGCSRNELKLKLKTPANWWADEMDKAERTKPAQPPAPCVGTAYWPGNVPALSATRIEKLLTNPYAIYVSKILGVTPLEPLDEAPQPKDNGQEFHAVLEEWYTSGKAGELQNFEQAYSELWTLAEARLKGFGLEAATYVFWEKQWQDMLRHFLMWDMAQPAAQAQILETRGEAELFGWKISATPDRLELLKGKGLRIIDYKTGRAKPKKEIENKWLLQLPLTAILAQHNAFGETYTQPPSVMEYWHLKEDSPSSVPPADEAGPYIDEVLAGLEALLSYYGSANATYLYDPHGRLPDKPYLDDVEHLARAKEWR